MFNCNKDIFNRKERNRIAKVASIFFATLA